MTHPDELVADWYDTHCTVCGRLLTVCAFDPDGCVEEDPEELNRRFDEAVAAGETFLTAPPPGWTGPVKEQGNG
jgi:hypothetical protein